MDFSTTFTDTTMSLQTFMELAVQYFERSVPPLQENVDENALIAVIETFKHMMSKSNETAESFSLPKWQSENAKDMTVESFLDTIIESIFYMSNYIMSKVHHFMNKNSMLKPYPDVETEVKNEIRRKTWGMMAFCAKKNKLTCENVLGCVCAYGSTNGIRFRQFHEYMTDVIKQHGGFRERQNTTFDKFDTELNDLLFENYDFPLKKN